MPNPYVNGIQDGNKIIDIQDVGLREKADPTTTSISGNPISIPNLKANQLAKDPIITLEPIQAGSGTPSPSNIRAISGYDKVEVESCGKNLFDPSKAVSGYISNNTGALQPSSTSNSTDFIRIKSSTTYKRIVGSGLSGNYGAIYDANKDFISGLNGSQETFTTQSNAAYVRFTVNYDNNNPNWRTNVTLTEDTSATTYVPYDKTTDISESLGQTVYGATWYPRTGVLDVAMPESCRVVLSDLTWEVRDTTTARVSLSVAAKFISSYQKVNAVCSGLEISEQAYIGQQNAGLSFNTETQIYVHIANASFTDSASVQTTLSGMVLVYEAKNHITIQLTPHEISLLKDFAYVSTNGTSIALDYHNGELASLGDVSQLGETVNELGDRILNSKQVQRVYGSVTANTRYEYCLTDDYPFFTATSMKGIMFSCVTGVSANDYTGTINWTIYQNKIYIIYDCKTTQNGAVMRIFMLY